MAPHEHPASLSDEDLLRSIGEACADCFALLFHRYCRQVYGVSYRILRDRLETEDIVQEVFLAIFLQQERYDPARGSIRTWILQFAYFKALLRRRYLSVRNFYRQEEMSEAREIRKPQTDPFGMTSSEWTRYVESGIAKLNPKQRQAIELVHFEGYTLKEVSEKIRETMANTRNTYYRGLKALRDFLDARAVLERAKETQLPQTGKAYDLES